MKRLLFYMAFSSILFLFSTSFAQDDMVKMIRSENYDVCGYHTGCYEQKNILIQVRNVAYEKQVFVHHLMSDGSWIDFPAHYLCPGNSTYELWSYDTSDLSYLISFGNQFVIKYVVLGNTYWDNNNGANYTLNPTDQMNGPGPMLGNNINVRLRQSGINSNNKLYAAIDVRNIGYAKDVKLTYTTNNWVTSTTMNAVYVSSNQTGYSSFIYWPNAYGIERWYVTSPTVVSCPLQFYISYTVNGQTYYDNNYWTNYLINN